VLRRGWEMGGADLWSPFLFPLRKKKGNHLRNRNFR